MDNLLPQLKIGHTKGELWDVAVATNDGSFATSNKKIAHPDPNALRAKLRTNFEHKRSSKKLAETFLRPPPDSPGNFFLTEEDEHCRQQNKSGPSPLGKALRGEASETIITPFRTETKKSFDARTSKRRSFLYGDASGSGSGGHSRGRASPPGSGTRKGRPNSRNGMARGAHQGARSLPEIVQFQLVNGSPAKEFDLYFMSLDSHTGIDHHSITCSEGLRRKLIKGSLSRLTHSQLTMVQEEQKSLEQASLNKSQIDEGPGNLSHDSCQDVASGITVVSSPMDRSPQGLGSRMTERSIEDEIPMVFCFQNGDASSARTLEIHWMDYDGQAVFRKLLKPGEAYMERTFATHPWLLHDVGNDEFLLIRFGEYASTAQLRYSLMWKSRSRSLSFMSQTAVSTGAVRDGLLHPQSKDERASTPKQNRERGLANSYISSRSKMMQQLQQMHKNPDTQMDADCTVLVL